MSKTIGAEISQDKSNEIEEYCKKNNITKSDFVKNSINNAMNQGVVHEQNQPTSSTEPTKKDIKDMSISELDALLNKENETKKYSKNYIENQVKPQIKSQSQKEILEHLKNNNCDFRKNCEICNIRDSIKNTGVKEQENKDLKIFEKYKNKFYNNQDNAYLTGLHNGILTMSKNPYQNPNDIYAVYHNEFVRNKIIN